MGKLFRKSCSTVNEHILNIFKEGELEKEISMRKIGKTDFSTKHTNYYNNEYERLEYETQCFFTI
jgi:hypothetical protein